MCSELEPGKTDYMKFDFAKENGLPTHFLKNARTLIKQIHDSSNQYLSNVTFGTSLALQMKEE